MSLEEQRQLLLSGKMYNDLTPELVQARERAVILTNEYNNSFGKGPQERLERIPRKSLLPASAYWPRSLTGCSRWCCRRFYPPMERGNCRQCE
jgi:hypothetical protein